MSNKFNTVCSMDKSTFSILFIMQKGKPNAEGNAPIFARITINHQMTHLATRYYLPADRWLPKEGLTVGRTKEEKEVNAYLDNLRGLIFAKYNEMFLTGEVVTARKLKCRLISKDERAKMSILNMKRIPTFISSLIAMAISWILHCRLYLPSTNRNFQGLAPQTNPLRAY